MNAPADCVVVVPCLNEARAIAPLVKSVREHVPTVIVVDDGSIDRTSELAASAGAEVVRHESPQGKGRALNTGWQRAAELGFQWALAMDGDGQHAAEDMPGFLNAAMSGDADLIVGNRFDNPGSMPWVRRVVNEWMSWRLSRIAGCPLPDSQCGFRMMRLAAWSRLKLRASHFEIESEMLLSFVVGGYAVQFIPVRTIYGAEQSKIKPLRDTMRWFQWLREAKAARNYLQPRMKHGWNTDLPRVPAAVRNKG